MKILCSACEAAEARVLCCADEAALCAACDREVHAANHLAGKHQRIPLLSPGGGGGCAAPAAPKCDICQECPAYFFCLEDRALLCRNCDVTIHTANPYVSVHRRFVLTGVQVGLESVESLEPISDEQLKAAAKPAESAAKSFSEIDVGQFVWAGNLANKPSYPDVAMTGNWPDWSVLDEQFDSPARSAELPTKSLPKRSSRGTLSSGNADVFSNQIGMDGGTADKMLPSGGLSGSMPDWPLDEIFGFTDFSNNFGFTENGTSKADSAKLGSSEGSSHYEDTNAEDFFGQVPEMQWSVPEIPSPPTASGLHWQKSSNHHHPSDNAASVPDICSPDSNFECFMSAAAAAAAKRRRRC